MASKTNELILTGLLYIEAFRLENLSVVTKTEYWNETDSLDVKTAENWDKVLCSMRVVLVESEGAILKALSPDMREELKEISNACLDTIREGNSLLCDAIEEIVRIGGSEPSGKLQNVCKTCSENLEKLMELFTGKFKETILELEDLWFTQRIASDAIFKEFLDSLEEVERVANAAAGGKKEALQQYTDLIKKAALRIDRENDGPT